MKIPNHIIGKHGKYVAIQNKEFITRIAKLWKEIQFIVDFLKKNYDIAPVFIGGLAVQYFGYSRMTEDIDILISREAYDLLVAEGMIKYGSLRIKPGLQIDVLTEGKDNNPNPEHIRGIDYFPTFEGLMYLKLLSGRMKDLGDVAELLKIQGMTTDLHNKVLNFLPTNLHNKFEQVWASAEKELNYGK